MSDYSIIVNNLPKKKGSKQKLLKFLDRCYEKTYTPYQITLLPEDDTFYEI